MGLVDPSLRKKEHGPKAVAKKAQRFYNSVVHGVADKKVEQQETSNMTQSLAVSSYAIDARRLREMRSWVVSFSISSRFRPRRGRRRGAAERARSLRWRLRGRAAAMASARRHVAATPSTRSHESLRAIDATRHGIDTTQVHHAPPEDEDGHV